MPTWLVHGFRWPRAQIRIHIILQNLDDAAPEWLMAPATVACMTKNFKDQWPETMAQLPDLQFIEQYDPDDFTIKDQPHAYVCDIVHEVKLGVDIEEVQGSEITDDQRAAITELRDKVAPGEKLAWFVVVNGDVERWAPPLEDDDATPEASQLSPYSQASSVLQSDISPAPEPERPSTSRSLKKWFGGKLRKTKSGRSLRGDAVAAAEEPAPPLPPISPRHALHAANGKAPEPKTAAP
ncbi:hypothetical protein COCSADRAFT_197843 [Bipolaris sorokiniana ND90Pr]|uniref:Developmental regulator n=1 Tax=Cochliobolus sativus (strain ND90Pr / ATCC 201652) TaxID=665912 RepID=M2SGK2_COCSN|nr:uncharacterized protein COCSADRAFT_197843 [Bipolaris sorokiniana ND90Pr]EMD66358.1 hypothetical protein COCSADRAFT_197843 [Bipolaris sorokiniana ND90Pr]